MLYNSASDDVKQHVAMFIEEAKQKKKTELEETKGTEVVDHQVYIDRLPGALTEFFNELQRLTGYVFTVLMGGPTPAMGGKIVVQSFHVGATEVGNQFDQVYPEFDSGIMRPWKEFTKCMFHKSESDLKFHKYMITDLITKDVMVPVESHSQAPSIPVKSHPRAPSKSTSMEPSTSVEPSLMSTSTEPAPVSTSVEPSPMSTSIEPAPVSTLAESAPVSSSTLAEPTPSSKVTVSLIVGPTLAESAPVSSSTSAEPTPSSKVTVSPIRNEIANSIGSEIASSRKRGSSTVNGAYKNCIPDSPHNKYITSVVEKGRLPLNGYISMIAH
ncbi:uncharacterized protein EDB93DRAFT_1107954 [Suillus bovinus]|uniref:uncharacterized protein n=1 Tax=Suillus bovinus TaxID=48563 RepID=UPI001B86AD24|nr:uncharacterized protein EDB93DRAFT_1107954 [Suillus bovinus]KAG2132114.1 hypothetical protein EDB93DRAFT_1107954 [Suillus bovinus]